MDNRRKWIKALRNLSLVSQIGISMVMPIIAGVLIGNYLDKKLGTTPLFLFVMIILGIGSSFTTLFKIVIKSQKDDKK